MEADQITQFLTIILVALVVILFILFTIFIVLSVKRKNEDKPKKIKKEEVLVTTKPKDTTSYNKQSIYNFMEFDKIEDNMIIRKNGTRYIMAIECQGINYDLMSGMEKNSVEQGFLQFLNTLRYPIQLYIQTRTVNLESSIATYKTRVDEVKDEYLKKQMEYNMLVNSGMNSPKAVEEARFELVKAQNLYEYGQDIIQNTEKMNFNKNILKKHYYVIISYMPEDISKTDYDAEEVKEMAFSELYTKAQSIISSLAVCEINGKVLNSKELTELLYMAYNRDEAEVYELEKVLNAGYEELYSTAPNVLEKRMIEINKEIERRAHDKANEAVRQALDNREREREVRQQEAQMNELIDAMAKNILDENEEMLGTETKDAAKEIIDG